MGKPAVNGLGSFYRYQNHFFTLDMVIILKPQDDANEILEKIKQFLAARGMEISVPKTKLTATTDGFDFLGWNFRVQKNGKLRSRPSVDNDNFRSFALTKFSKYAVGCDR